MKTCLKLTLLFMVIFFDYNSIAQPFQDPVTIGIFKPKKSRLEYRFNNTTLSKVRIKTIDPQKKHIKEEKWHVTW